MFAEQEEGVLLAAALDTARGMLCARSPYPASSQARRRTARTRHARRRTLGRRPDSKPGTKISRPRLKTTAMTGYSALTHTRPHMRRVPGVPGSAKRRLFNRGHDLVLCAMGLHDPRHASHCAHLTAVHPSAQLPSLPADAHRAPRPQATDWARKGTPSDSHAPAGYS